MTGLAPTPELPGWLDVFFIFMSKVWQYHTVHCDITAGVNYVRSLYVRAVLC